MCRRGMIQHLDNKINNMTNENNTIQRQSFTFYLSFEKAISKLEDSDQLTIYRAIARYSLFGEEPTNLTGFAQLAWDLLEPTLKKSRANYINGTKGGAPKGNKNNRFSKSTTEVQPKYKPEYNTDTDTDTDTETDNKINISNLNRLECKKPKAFLPSTPEKLDNKDFEAVKDLWNECCPRLMRVAKLASKRPSRRNRKAAITVCVKMLAEQTRNGSKAEAIAMLKEVFNRVQNSDFLCGKNENGWCATFDWVMKVDNMVKIIEGNFDDPNSTPRGNDWS